MGAQRQALQLGQVVFRQRRAPVLASARRVAVAVVVPLAVGDRDFDHRQRRRFLAMLVEHGDGDLPAHDVAFDEHAVAVGQRFPKRRRQVAAVGQRRQAQGRTLAQRLDHHAPAEFLADALGRARWIAARRDQQIFRHRQPFGAKQRLGHVLVRRHRAAEHVAADERQAEHRQQPLHRAVFTGRTVQHRKHHVRCQRLQPGDEFGVQFDAGHRVAAALKRLGDASGG